MRTLMPFAAVCLFGCLPDDLRDPPASVLVTVEPSLATSEGFATTEGWFVRFSQVALNIGRVGFPDDDDCTYYSFTQYSWLMDLTVAEREKAGEVHALGDCKLQFDAPVVDPDVTRLGVGADHALLDLMSSRFSVVVFGYAERDERLIPFDFSLEYFSLGPCLDEIGSTSLASFRLESDGRYELPLLASPEALISPVSSPGVSHLDFEAADTNEDGYLTQDELGNALVSLGDYEAEVGGKRYTLLSNFLRLRDGGACLWVEVPTQGFNPF